MLRSAILQVNLANGDQHSGGMTRWLGVSHTFSE
jgi:hypothetical protein